MGIAPSEFWLMGWREFLDAAHGFAEFHGAETERNKLTADEAADIVARGEAMLERQRKAASRGD
jgi:hypothetical protein